jgi:hypothetical protein
MLPTLQLLHGGSRKLTRSHQVVTAQTNWHGVIVVFQCQWEQIPWIAGVDEEGQNTLCHMPGVDMKNGNRYLTDPIGPGLYACKYASACATCAYCFSAV